jgi:hypothetical protein
MSAASQAISWALMAACLVAGWMGWGWRGLVLAVTVIVFWLLLQLSRTLRVMRAAAARPVGRVASAVMLQSRLVAGRSLLQVITLTGSLGERLCDAPEVWRWRDDGGDAVDVRLEAGRVQSWVLRRAGDAAQQAPSATAPPAQGL